MENSEKIMMHGNNFNQRLVVHLPTDICRTIIGSGGAEVIMQEMSQR